MDDRRICNSWIVLLASWLTCVIAPIVFGADPNRVAVDKILTGLNRPHGVAVRPEGSADIYEIFVAETGAGRVIKIRNDRPEKRVDVVSGFSATSASEDRLTSAGAHSIQFLDHLRLVVAGGDDDGFAFVRLYELPEPVSPLTADQHKQEAKVPESGKEQDFKPHVFRSLARTQLNDRVGDFLVAIAPTDSGSAQLVNVPVRSGVLGDAVPAQLKDASGNFQIGGVAVGTSGYVVVAANAAGDSTEPSRLLFISPIDRHIVMQLSIDLGHITALAYSPRSGNLFAASSSSNKDGRSGVYRIDRRDQPGTSGCTAVKIIDARNPTALAFAPNGVLYVTAAGDRNSKNSGELLKVTGEL